MPNTIRPATKALESETSWSSLSPITVNPKAQSSAGVQNSIGAKVSLKIGDDATMRHNLAYLKRLSDEIDKLVSEKSKPLDPEWATQLADLRDYFFYLTTDAMQDRKLAMRLVGHFERLEAQSRAHHRFFFSLSQLLSIKHKTRRVLGKNSHARRSSAASSEQLRSPGCEGRNRAIYQRHEIP